MTERLHFNKRPNVCFIIKVRLHPHADTDARMLLLPVNIWSHHYMQYVITSQYLTLGTETLVTGGRPNRIWFICVNQLLKILRDQHQLMMTLPTGFQYKHMPTSHRNKETDFQFICIWKCVQEICTVYTVCRRYSRGKRKHTISYWMLTPVILWHHKRVSHHILLVWESIKIPHLVFGFCCMAAVGLWAAPVQWSSPNPHTTSSGCLSCHKPLSGLRTWLGFEHWVEIELQVRQETYH